MAFFSSFPVMRGSLFAFDGFLILIFWRSCGIALPVSVWHAAELASQDQLAPDRFTQASVYQLVERARPCSNGY